MRCRYHGGEFSPGGFLDLWTCSLGASVTFGTPDSRWEQVAADLKKAEYCPTGAIEDSIVDKDLGFVTCLK